MGLRESINNNKGIGVTVGVCLIAVAVVAIVWPSTGGSAGRGGAGKAFYTVDDGTTWFIDDANKVVPFDHHGKQAVACYVYRCGESGQPWVSHLMRYTPDGKKLREQEQAPESAEFMSTTAGQMNVEVKKPKDPGEWISVTDPRAAAIQELKCPDGSKQNMIALDPNQ